MSGRVLKKKKKAFQAEETKCRGSEGRDSCLAPGLVPVWSLVVEQSGPEGPEGGLDSRSNSRITRGATVHPFSSLCFCPSVPQILHFKSFRDLTILQTLSHGGSTNEGALEGIQDVRSSKE